VNKIQKSGGAPGVVESLTARIPHSVFCSARSSDCIRESVRPLSKLCSTYQLHGCCVELYSAAWWVVVVLARVPVDGFHRQGPGGNSRLESEKSGGIKHHHHLLVSTGACFCPRQFSVRYASGPFGLGIGSSKYWIHPRHVVVPPCLTLTALAAQSHHTRKEPISDAT